MNIRNVKRDKDEPEWSTRSGLISKRHELRAQNDKEPYTTMIPFNLQFTRRAYYLNVQ